MSTETVHVTGVARCSSVKLAGVMVVPSIAWLKVTLGFLLTDTSDALLTGRLERTFSAALASAFASRGASGGASNPLFPSLLASPPPFASDAVSEAAANHEPARARFPSLYYSPQQVPRKRSRVAIPESKTVRRMQAPTQPTAARTRMDVSRCSTRRPKPVGNATTHCICKGARKASRCM